MSAGLNYDTLRKQTLSAGKDEAVTVNTRALIDKVLARYSGEWTTLRELLQNAADASSKKVKITIETLPSAQVPVPQGADDAARLRHVFSHHTIASLKVENDGEYFRSTDWARLKKIAEGNPDETKIGAFGVGFYSVFADCEEPFVSSGQDALAFFWKSDALFTKSLRLPNNQSSSTTFVLPYRNRDAPIPDLFSLSRFLASSLTFVGLEGIELWFDEWNLLTLKKKSAPSIDLAIPREIAKKTKDGLMNVATISKEVAQLDARWMNVIEWDRKASGTTADKNVAAKSGPSTQSLRGLFHRLAPGVSSNAAVEKQAKLERERQSQLRETLLEVAESTIFVHVFKGSIKTSVNPAFAAELERATKKPPPKSLAISLLSASYDENNASSSLSNRGSKIFESFVPANGKGRIFIGFTTQQTTGLDIHISTPAVIPTVERESIDLNNRFIKYWNIEILRAAGIMVRVAWGEEMSILQSKLQRRVQAGGRKRVSKEDVLDVTPEASFLHKSYGWAETTPSAEVGTLMEEAFWTCNQKTPISILSSCGVLPANRVRLEQDELDFVNGIPTLPSALKSTTLARKLIDYGMISDVTVSDVKSELEAKALSALQLRRFLDWLLHKVQIHEIDEAIGRSLLSVTVANDDDGKEPRLIVLSEMTNFINPSRIPVDMPVPSTVIPFKFTKDISKHLLELLFEDLQIIPWLRWLVESTGSRNGLTVEQDLCASSPFATSVLLAISKQWDGMSQSSRATAVNILSNRTTMPTKMGMRKPPEAYFPSVKLFDDLPVVVGLYSAKDKFLAALGVRKTIDIGVVFDRLLKPPGDNKAGADVPQWSHVDLIKYLASVQRDIPSTDIDRLRKAKICPAEGGEERYIISDLHQPNAATRQLQFPVLQWPGMYRPESSEGKFLSFLGLRAHPSFRDVVMLMATAHESGDTSLRELALRYYIDHHHVNGYGSQDANSLARPFLPIQGNEKSIARPTEVFVNEKASTLGFAILRRDMQVHALKFGVKQDPPMAVCIERLICQPPATKRAARDVFGYFAGRLTELKNADIENFRDANIVPVLVTKSQDEKSEDSKRIKHVMPQLCFLGYGDTKYADIFDYVDFGQEANSFLLAIGSKHEPSISEIAQRLAHEPARFYAILGDLRYLDLLRTIAGHWAVLKKDKPLIKGLRASKCLLAYKEILNGAEKDEEEDESAIKVWELAKAADIIVVDDFNAYKYFREALLVAPMEDSLEAMYNALGSFPLSELMEVRTSTGAPERDQSQATALQRLIHERSRLFLHDYNKSETRRTHDWIQKNLSVRSVQTLRTTYSLRGSNIRRQLIKHAVGPSEEPVLLITRGFTMFDIAQALLPTLLNRVTPQATFMLEMMLESSLSKLRSRGYNVQRIMNEKAREAKIAEERRQEQEAEERRLIKEREAAWAQTRVEDDLRAKDQQMPGVFPGPHDQHNGHPSESMALTSSNGASAELGKSRGLFSGLSKQFDSLKRQISQQPSPSANPPKASDGTHEAPPPPYSDGNNGHEAVAQRRPTVQTQSVTAPHQVQQNLMNMIGESRAHNSGVVNSVPKYNDVKEKDSYCDSEKGHHLRAIGELPPVSGSIRIFIDRDVETKGGPATGQTFMANNAQGLTLFAEVLLTCAESFSLRRSALHIFYDDAGHTVAFNTNKALFFNYRYFDALHQGAIRGGAAAVGNARAKAVAYWSVTMAHELAHNFVSTHSAQHSYYTESLVAEYFDRIAVKAMEAEARPAIAAPNAPSLMLAT